MPYRAIRLRQQLPPEWDFTKWGPPVSKTSLIGSTEYWGMPCPRKQTPGSICGTVLFEYKSMHLSDLQMQNSPGMDLCQDLLHCCHLERALRWVSSPESDRVPYLSWVPQNSKQAVNFLSQNRGISRQCQRQNHAIETGWSASEL